MRAEMLENILENVDSGIFVLDRQGNILYANNMAIQIFGHPKQVVLQYNTYRAYEEGFIDVHILNRVVETKRQVTACQVFCRKNSTHTAPILVTQTPVLDANTEVIYSIGIMRDMRSLSQNYEKAQKAMTGRVFSVGPIVPNSFIYESELMYNLVKRVDQVVNSDATILIMGESGTGKEVLAQYIHSTSSRSVKEMVTINCATLPENLLEAELFGYEKGAFTGAHTGGKAGLVELADHSTLFLDEIDSLPLALQGKLLRVIETHEVRRLGGFKSKKVDFRVLAATNANLKKRIEEKTFRSDLYFRLSVVPISIPPLRDRKEDIKPLCEAFLAYYDLKYGRRKEFLPRAYEEILRYEWPGNVRELKNFVERMVLMTDVAVTEIDRISEDMIAAEVDSTPVEIRAHTFLPTNNDADTGTFPLQYNKEKSLKNHVREYEQWLVRRALADCGSYSKAAKQLGIDRSTLVRKR